MPVLSILAYFFYAIKKAVTIYYINSIINNKITNCFDI